MVLFVFTTAVGYAQELANQGAIDKAKQEVADAEQEARDNIPGNRRVKEAEDALDAAIRKNEDLPEPPVNDTNKVHDKDQAQKAQVAAQDLADSIRAEMAARTRADQAKRATKYRDALQKRREARKKLRHELAVAQDALRGARTNITDAQPADAALREIHKAITKAERIITADMQIGGVPQRSARPKFGADIEALVFRPPQMQGGPQVPAAQNKFDVAVSGGFAFASLPTRGFLGRELIGSGVQEVNQVAPTRRASGSDFEAALNYGSDSTHFQIKIGHSQLSASETGGSYDPGAGHLLLIPGPNGGASGFSLPANPLNIVRNTNYKNDISAWDVAFGYTGEVTRWRFGGGGTARVEGVVGAGARWGDYNETFSGQIPGFARNFGYSTNVNVNSARGIFGANLVLSFPDSAIPFDFKTAATISPMILRALGTDSLDFTGFPTSSQDLSKNKTDVGYGVTAEFNIKPRESPVIFDIKIGWEHLPGLPVIQRNGFGPSDLSFNSGDAFVILVGARYYGGRLN